MMMTVVMMTDCFEDSTDDCGGDDEGGTGYGGGDNDGSGVSAVTIMTKNM